MFRYAAAVERPAAYQPLVLVLVLVRNQIREKTEAKIPASETYATGGIIGKFPTIVAGGGRCGRLALR